VKFSFKGIPSAVIAIATGAIVLLGYFFVTPLLTSTRVTLVNWAAILSAFAIFVGIVNLLAVHFNKIRKKEKGRGYSIVLVVALFVTLILGLALRPEHPVLSAVFNSVQLPVEASLMAVLAVTLTYASIRMLRRRLNIFGIIFIATTLFLLLITAPLPFIGNDPFLSGMLRPFVTQVLAAGGARGILIGVALGTLTIGLRILFGADRPYGGK
jgi:membrane-associated HD superfamily phosphohydrolase